MEEQLGLDKDVFLRIIESSGIPFNEGINDDAINSNPRIIFWDFVWEPISASGTTYNTLCTYQVSYFSDMPPRSSTELLNLLKELLKVNVNPSVNHEYIEKSKTWHSYFSIDLLENLLIDV